MDDHRNCFHLLVLSSPAALHLLVLFAAQVEYSTAPLQVQRSSCSGASVPRFVGCGTTKRETTAPLCRSRERRNNGATETSLV